MIAVTAKRLAVELVKIQKKSVSGQIIYGQEDIISLLKKYGFPEPDFDLQLDDFRDKKRAR
jgi:hypothetical protein